MLFNSFDFLIFFTFVIVLYFSLPFKYRNTLLLFSSYYFYMSWNTKYFVLILFVTVINYLAGLNISSTNDNKKRKFYLIVSLSVSLGLLFIFKYLNFFTATTVFIFKKFFLDLNTPTFNILLPVGISFYTFQTLSYTIDVYMDKLKPEKNFFTFALFVSFFPQLVAGPIERSTNLLPQFHKHYSFDYDRVINGLLIALVGFTKKMIVADRISILVDEIYNNPYEYSGLTVIIATLAFAIQIYYDFSGYSDIAQGIAQIMGYDLMDNFKKPYAAKSISEFWRRWHISLSSWLKDYLYIPLGGSKVSKSRTYINLVVTFLLSGLWHGANWTFVIWGGLHGLYSIVGVLIRNYKQNLLYRLKNFSKLVSLIQISITFILVDFAWIFFRANSLSDSVTIVKGIFTFNFNLTSVYHLFWKCNFTKIDLFIVIITTVIIESLNYSKHGRFIDFNRYKIPTIIRWPIYFIVIFFIISFAVYGKANQFIYFQF